MELRCQFSLLGRTELRDAKVLTEFWPVEYHAECHKESAFPTVTKHLRLSICWNANSSAFKSIVIERGYGWVLMPAKDINLEATNHYGVSVLLYQVTRSSSIVQA